jgi:hypothetical protein
MPTTYEEAIENLKCHFKEDRIIRGAWKDVNRNGRETACLLAAMVPDCGKSEKVEMCPAHVMPQWLAEVTLFIDDMGTQEEWKKTAIPRYVDLASRWHILSQNEWDRLFYWMKWAVLNLVSKHPIPGGPTTWLSVCSDMMSVLDKKVRGQSILPEDWVNVCVKMKAAGRLSHYSSWADSIAVYAIDDRANSIDKMVRTAAQWITRAGDLETGVGADMLITVILDTLEDAIKRAEENFAWRNPLLIPPAGGGR